ncbi:MAG: DUF4184 family protein [Candidatus Odinarchaeum yellowstonii]|uniref:DUF4184 family protein n=1 Tax=Odinarchaeota yellowstonii (strain LCB_4) TaxID=1841599 RepID=A0AAF0D2F3_ODILC|nr:MAG: DUF4184 family protein [Candidatus Odinarchaeum yellowstonii]
MPLTPLHYPVAFILYHVSKRHLNLPVLIISSMIPDLEIPLIFFLTGGLIDRLILHSLIGGVVFGVPLTILVFYPLYKIFFKKIAGDISFNGASYKILVLSATIGVLSHTLLDSTQHPYNPLLWPISYNSFNNFILFGDLILASNLLYIIFTISTIAIIVYILLNGRGFLNQIFIG